MAPKLVLAPAAAGKTRYCVQRVRSVLRSDPLAPVWVLLPSRAQVQSFHRRLAQAGGAMGARVATFSDLYAALVAVAGRALPVAPEPVMYRLALAAIDASADRGALQHYSPIRRKPGFIRLLMSLTAELKRARVEPRQFTNAAAGMGRRLEELALLYQEYESALARIAWVDPEGLGWHAVKALQDDQTLARGWTLVIADGFDSFTHTQLEALRLLGSRVDELSLTLTGDRHMQRTAFRRFQRTLDQVQVALAPEIESLPSHASPVPPLAHLETALFETKAPIDPARHVAFAEAQTPALEARQALRWIKERIVVDHVPSEQCAVVAYDLLPYRAFLREVGREFGLPLFFVGGESLASNPAIAAILNLVDLPAQGWARRPLLDALRTPYLDLSGFGLSPADEPRFKQVAYWGQVIVGVEQWEQVFESLTQMPAPPHDSEDEDVSAPRSPTGEAARSLSASLKRFVDRATPPATGSPEEFVEWLENLVSHQDGLGVEYTIGVREDTRLRDRAAFAEFRDVLRSLQLSEQIVGEQRQLTWPEFVQELRGAVEAADYTPDDQGSATQGAVSIAPLTAARGVPFRAVALLGLSEGLFPAPLAQDPFISDEERERLNTQGIPLEPRLRSDQQTLFYEAVTRAGEYLLLTRPYLSDDGESWAPSPYWQEARALFDSEPETIRLEQPFAQAASQAELLAAAVRRRSLPKRYASLEPEWHALQRAAAVLRARLARDVDGEFEGGLEALAAALAHRYAESHVWSASRIETYAACPFRFLISSALDLEPRETPEAGFDAAQLGGMLHAILERVYQRAADPSSADSIVAALPDVAGEVFDEAPMRWGFRPTPLWQAERAELVERLKETVRGLAEETRGSRPRGLEARFGFAGSPAFAVDTAIGKVRFHGVVDRVDVREDGTARVIDYKTGSRDLDVRALGEGRRLQLVIYALATEMALKLGRVVDGFYWAILKAEAGSLRLAKFEFTTDDRREFSGLPAAIELGREHIARNVNGIRAGQFAPVPPRQGCPDYCAARTICWRYRPMVER